MKRIGMLTSGGDCQALNATMRGIVKGVCNALDEVELYGFEEGYKGLIYGNYRMLTPRDFSGILTKGGTILGSSRQPFKMMRRPAPFQQPVRQGGLAVVNVGDDGEVADIALFRHIDKTSVGKSTRISHGANFDGITAYDAAVWN